VASSSIENRLGDVRKGRGVTAADLARRVGVSRQTIHAIEAGSYIPNTELSLRMARELETSIEDLFSLPAGEPVAAESLAADILIAAPAAAGQAVRVCKVGEKWVGVPVSATPYYLPEADGLIRRLGIGGRAGLMALGKEDGRKRLVVAGCDPAMSLLARAVERESGVEIVPAAASSSLAMAWLKQGKVHIAGSHLEDPATGEFNVPFIHEQFRGEEILVVTFAAWEEGLCTAPGNPKRLRAAADLARRGVRIVNREKGSGSRALLDKLLTQAGVPANRIHGYASVAFGHLAAAHEVYSGQADACLATRPAAKAFGLDFVPLHTARYDLAMRKNTADTTAARALLDALQRAGLRRKLEALAGYDTARTGSLAD
jgi:putative molybdopterin biosynthesis protein